VISINCAQLGLHLAAKLKPGNRALGRLFGLSSKIGLMTVFIIIAGAFDASAVQLFRYEAQAQRHCPTDSVVWLDFNKRTYYSKRQKLYARGTYGSFVCRSEVPAYGYRRSLLGFR
jgi:hypothetical protein